MKQLQIYYDEPDYVPESKALFKEAVSRLESAMRMYGEKRDRAKGQQRIHDLEHFRDILRIISSIRLQYID